MEAVPERTEIGAETRSSPALGNRAAPGGAREIHCAGSVPLPAPQSSPTPARRAHSKLEIVLLSSLLIPGTSLPYNLRIRIDILLDLQVIKQAGSRIRIGICKQIMVPV